MPITIISYQPINNSLNVAYRPIVFRCRAKIPFATLSNYLSPIVYCDIYVDDVYYKTFSKTQYVKNSFTIPVYGTDTFAGVNFLNNNWTPPEYEFDIQDALQEVMGYNLPTIDGAEILELTNTVKKVFVKIRNAYLDENGFVVSEQTAPIQGDVLNPPVPGQGTLSNEIWVYNATLQHEDNQNFNQFLDGWKTGIWNPESFPLTKKPKVIKICQTDSSYFPISTTSNVRCLELNYKLKGQSNYLKSRWCKQIDRCNLYVSSVVPTINGALIDLSWINSAGLPDSFKIEISTTPIVNSIQGPTNFYTPPNLIINQNKTSATYSKPNVSHFLWIRPYCIGDTPGTGSMQFFQYPCILPDLQNIFKYPLSNDVTFNWSTQGFNYGAGLVQMQYSIDGGITWISDSSNIPANDGVGVFAINSVPDNTAIKYRIICSGNGCDNQISNIINDIWEPRPDYLIVVSPNPTYSITGTGTITVVNAPVTIKLEAFGGIVPGNYAKGFVEIDGIGSFDTITAQAYETKTTNITIIMPGVYDVLELRNSGIGQYSSVKLH
jgi:hypothetical protein